MTVHSHFKTLYIVLEFLFRKLQSSISNYPIFYCIRNMNHCLINVSATGNVINIVNSKNVRWGNDYYMGPTNMKPPTNTNCKDEKESEENIEKNNLIKLLMEAKIKVRWSISFSWLWTQTRLTGGRILCLAVHTRSFLEPPPFWSLTCELA